MLEDIVGAVVSKLIGSVPKLLIFCGLVLLTFGIVGGIAYQNWLPLPQLIPRALISVVGMMVFVLGIRMSVSPDGVPSASAFAIKIVHPRDGDILGKVDVRGTIKKAPPAGYSLYVFRLYPGMEQFVSMAKATVDIRNQTWEAVSCDIGGRSGDRRQIGAYLVGPGGTVLVEYLREAKSVLDRVSQQLNKATGAARVWLPPIPTKTPDMVECARVSVTRA